jgi:hypothetical protein
LTTYARLTPDGQTIIEICPHSPPTGFYTPDVAAQFVVVPDGVGQGWHLVGGTWTAPTVSPPPPPVTVNPTVAASSFYQLFTFPEKDLLYAAGAGTSPYTAADPLIKTFLQEFNDPRIEFVNLNRPSIIQAVGYLSTTTPPVIAPARVAQILAAQEQ